MNQTDPGQTERDKRNIFVKGLSAATVTVFFCSPLPKNTPTSSSEANMRFIANNSSDDGAAETAQSHGEANMRNGPNDDGD